MFSAHLRAQALSKQAGAWKRIQAWTASEVAGVVHPEPLDPDDLITLLILAEPVEPKPVRPRPAQTLVRPFDPDTSFEAALSITPQGRKELFAAIVHCLRQRPLTDEELLSAVRASRTSCTPSGVRSRRAELADAGWVVDSGDRRRTQAGGKAIVWRLAVDS